MRWALLGAAGVAIALVAYATFTHLVELTSKVQSVGALGAASFVVGFAVASAAFVPAGLLTLAAGALFGFAAGTAYAFAGAVLGSCIAFALARSIGRPMVQRYLARRPRLAAISAAVGGKGRRIVTLLRLSPVIPFSVINVVMAVTPIRFTDFAVAGIGMLPVTALYAYYGAVAGTIAMAEHGGVRRGTAYYVLLVIGLLATVIVTSVVARAAARALDAEVGASS